MKIAFSMLLLGASIIGLLCSCGRPKLSPGPTVKLFVPVPGEAAVVYAQRIPGGAQICWRDLASPEVHTVYTSSDPYLVPDYLGYLPSPDAKWLLIWETRRQGSSYTTHWLVVRLLDGKTKKLGENHGKAWFLPYWIDEGHLLLESEESSVIFDIESEGPLRPLPSGPAPEERIHSAAARKRLIAYNEKHYSAQWQAWEPVIAKMDRHLDLAQFVWPPMPKELREPREYILLRSLGIPGLNRLRPLTGGILAVVPYIACSSNGRYIAGARQYDCRLKIHSIGTEASIPGSELRVFDVASSEVLYRETIEPLERPLSPEELTSRRKPPVLPFVVPDFWDIRFSRDDRFLTFTTVHEKLHPAYSVVILDTASWSEVLRLPGALNAFIIPLPREQKE